MGLRTPMVPGANRMWRSSARTLGPVLRLLTRRHWQGARQLGDRGGAILVANHVSQVDPILAAHFVWEHQRRVPSFMAKESLFTNRYVGWWFRGTDHVRVDRAAGAASIEPALAALRDGKVVLVYVEGSITRDPEGWPMVPKTGAARIALASGAPVFPLAQWGAQDLMKAYSGKLNLRRTDVTFRIGDPVPLGDLRGRQDDPVAVHQATDRIMAAIVAELEQVRGERAPAERYDPTVHGTTRYGRPA